MTQSNSESKTTYLLEMNDPAELSAKRTELSELEIKQVKLACPEFNWFLHQAVGAAYRWGGREDWDCSRWKQYVDRPEVETWVAYFSGSPAGYYELEKQKDNSVRIECFGLLPTFMGRGLGSHLLSEAVERAWNIGATRVWLTTCSHDHDHALPNYIARGFRLVKETIGAPIQRQQSVLFTSRAIS